MFLLLGIDSQSRTHLAMPVRNMLYDSLSYVKQIEDIKSRYEQAHDYGNSPEEFLSGLHRKDRLLPVVTAVMNLSSGPWDGPLSLHEMLDIREEELLPWIQDYRIHVIDPHRMMDGELEQFATDLGMVLKWIKYAGDKEGLKRTVRPDTHRQVISMDAVRMIESHTNTRFTHGEEEGKEEMDVCLALDMMMEDARSEGLSQGISRGISQGITQGENRLAQLILCLQKDGRIEDMVTVATDADMRNRLYRFYGI